MTIIARARPSRATLKEYTDQGNSITDLTRVFAISATTVSRWLRSYGLTTNSKPGRRPTVYKDVTAKAIGEYALLKNCKAIQFNQKWLSRSLVK